MKSNPQWITYSPNCHFSTIRIIQPTGLWAWRALIYFSGIAWCIHLINAIFPTMWARCAVLGTCEV